MKKLSMIRAILLVMLFVLLPVSSVSAQSEDTISKGVFIDGVDVSGMTQEQARQAVEEYVAGLDAVEITLNVIDDKKVVKTAGELGLEWANPEMTEEALSVGKKGNIIQRYKARKDLEKQNKVLNMQFSVNQETARKILEEECAKYNQEAVDATLVRENGKFTVKDGQKGTVVSVDESLEAISTYLKSEWNHEAASIDLAVTVDEPQGKEEELLKVKDVLGTFTTGFPSSSKDRVGNVDNGAKLINGTTLYPGDEFSMYQEVSPFTADNGYYMAGSYLNGMVVDSLGGGICQVSTTLYNAVLLAELEVTERYNHSMIVTYVDPSADAAIAGTSKDFKFKNNTQAPLYIEAYTTPDRKITFTIYGVETRPATRKVTYVSEVLSKTPPEAERIIADAGQPVGVIQVQSSHTGYTARLWKVVEENGVEVSRTQVNKSSYKQSPRTATVGMSTPDPNVLAAMQAAVATGSIDHVKGVVGAYKAAQAQAIAEAQAAQAAQAAQQPPADPAAPPAQ